MSYHNNWKTPGEPDGEVNVWNRAEAITQRVTLRENNLLQALENYDVWSAANSARVLIIDLDPYIKKDKREELIKALERVMIIHKRAKAANNDPVLMNIALGTMEEVARELRNISQDVGLDFEKEIDPDRIWAEG